MATIKRQRADGSWEYIQMTGEDVITLKNEIAAHLAERGTLTKAGHVQLNSATNSTDETTAATPKAVKAAYDRADSAFTSANNGKVLVRDTIIGKGGMVADADGDGVPTFRELADSITTVQNAHDIGDMQNIKHTNDGTSDVQAFYFFNGFKYTVEGGRLKKYNSLGTLLSDLPIALNGLAWAFLTKRYVIISEAPMIWNGAIGKYEFHCTLTFYDYNLSLIRKVFLFKTINNNSSYIAYIDDKDWAILKEGGIMKITDSNGTVLYSPNINVGEGKMINVSKNTWVQMWTNISKVGITVYHKNSDNTWVSTSYGGGSYGQGDGRWIEAFITWY